jgi:hypothetical protein
MRTGDAIGVRTHHTMALDRSALLDVLDALKVADVQDRIRLSRKPLQ